MNTEKFAITLEGVVYRREVHEWTFLGHISCLAREEAPLGREVRAWWQARLGSDEPSENLVISGGREEPYFVRISPTAGLSSSAELSTVAAPKGVEGMEPVEEFMPLQQPAFDQNHSTCADTQSLPPFGEPCELLS